MAQSETIQKVFVVVITAMITILATLVLAGSNSISRDDAQDLVHATEERLTQEVTSLKFEQKIMADRVEKILVEQIKTTTKLELLLQK